VRLRAVVEPERLLDEIDPAEFAADERMPYWATLWPSSLVLARVLLDADAGRPFRLRRGERAIELGTGLGLVGIAAALAGAFVCLTDYVEESLDHAAANARLNGLREGFDFETRLLDWRLAAVPEPFDVALGSDLLYEARNVEPVLSALDRVLSPGTGRALIADPQRPAAPAFEAEARRRGFALDRQLFDPEAGAGGRAVAVYRIGPGGKDD